MTLIFEKNYKDMKKLINQNRFKKIFIITGKNSFFKSGAEKYFKSLFLNKKIKFFFKNKRFPEIKELSNIIKFLDHYNQHMILNYLKEQPEKL